MEKTPLASLSIAARATLNMHSLNNEGGEGNQIHTREVEIVDQYGDLHTVNAISGDMLKHVLTEHFHRLAREQGISLCTSCQTFNANRINADDPFFEETKALKDAEFVSAFLKRCAIDDIGGVLVTEKGRSIPRKSVSEFGWVIGMPGRVSTESYFHAKYVSERSKERRTKDAEDQQKSGSNRGQNIFHRPASSGVYAIVCHLEIARIGYNDITKTYAIDEAERAKRTTLLLESLLHTFIELNGAMRSTQLPHLISLDGVITTSSGVTPAPLISPLLNEIEDDDDPDAYRQQTKEIVDSLNGSGEKVQVDTFDTVGRFAQHMRALADNRIPFAFRQAH